MKTREGFVSNSSTSSFVVMGFVLDESVMSKDDILLFLGVDVEAERARCHEEDDDWEDRFDEVFWEAMDGSGFEIRMGGDDGGPKGKVLVGVPVASFDDAGACDSQSNLADVLVKVDALRKKLALGDDVPVQVCSGTYAC